MKKLFILCLLLCVGCSYKKVIEDVPDVIETKEYNMSMIFAGDSLIHSALYYDAKIDNDTYDFTSMFDLVKPIISSFDVSFINQETIIGGKSLGLSSYPRFNSPEEVGDAVVDTGFDIINLANNHTLDMNEIGIVNSLNYWKTKDVITIGSNESFESRDTIKTYEKNGITYAIFGYTTVTNGLSVPEGKEYLLNVYNEEQVKKDIESVKDKVDIVMVSMHYGSEYTHEPTLEEVNVVNYLSSLGVDIVIGHHPHVIQPVAYVNDTLVIYSLGNFISGQVGNDKKIGMLVSLDVKKTVTGDDTNIEISNVAGNLVYTYSNSSYKDYKVYPFNQLNDTILPDYQSLETDYGNIINSYDSSIKVNTFWGD